MKWKNIKILFHKKGVKSFVAIWLIGFGIIAGRLVFDLKTYFYGSTLVYHNVLGTGYDYLLHLPKGHSDFDNPRPLLIYLHGAGEVGKDVRILKQLDVVGFSKNKVEKEDFPFIVVSPMTPIRGWRPELVIRLLDEILVDHGKRWKLDEKRVYLTGFSMGGFGTFRTGGEYPERFAAIAPIAGGGDPDEAEHFQNLPTWAFHGDVDDIVPYDCSSKMIEAMQTNHCMEAKLTTMEGAGHGIVRDVYSNPELYRWMLKHERK